MISLIARLLGAATLGSTLAGFTLTRHMIARLIDLVALVVVSALLFTGLLAGGLYGVYVLLVTYGLEPIAAGVSVGALASLITLAFIWSTCVRLRHFHALSSHKISNDMPGMSHISGIADAFLDGLLSQPTHSKR